MAIHVDDVGTVMTFTFLSGDVADTPIDLATATDIQLILKSPKGTRKTKTLAKTTDGHDGMAQFTSVAGDFHEAGTWKAEGCLTTATGKWWSSEAQFTVEAHL
jgi:hypothetical protein